MRTKEEIKEYQRQYYLLNKDKAKQRVKDWVKENPVKKKVNANNYARKFRTEIKYKNRLIIAKEKSKPFFLKRDQIDREELNDGYIKKLLSQYNGIPIKDIPKELIEIKRLIIKSKRILSQPKNK